LSFFTDKEITITNKIIKDTFIKQV